METSWIAGALGLLVVLSWMGRGRSRRRGTIAGMLTRDASCAERVR